MKSYWITSAVIFAVAFVWAFGLWFNTDKAAPFSASLLYFALFVYSVLMARGIRKQLSSGNE
jgi:hypothetical protein